MKASLIGPDRKVIGVVDLGPLPWPPVLSWGGRFFYRNRGIKHLEFYEVEVRAIADADVQPPPQTPVTPHTIAEQCGGQGTTSLGDGGTVWYFPTPAMAQFAWARMRSVFPYAFSLQGRHVFWKPAKPETK